MQHSFIILYVRRAVPCAQLPQAEAGKEGNSCSKDPSWLQPFASECPFHDAQGTGDKVEDLGLPGGEIEKLQTHHALGQCTLATDAAGGVHQAAAQGPTSMGGHDGQMRSPSSFPFDVEVWWRAQFVSSSVVGWPLNNA